MLERGKPPAHFHDVTALSGDSRAAFCTRRYARPGRRHPQRPHRAGRSLAHARARPGAAVAAHGSPAGRRKGAGGARDL